MHILLGIGLVYLFLVVVAAIGGYFSGNYMFDMERAKRLKKLSK